MIGPDTSSARHNGVTLRRPIRRPFAWALAASVACVAVIWAWRATGAGFAAASMLTNMYLAWIPVALGWGILRIARSRASAAWLAVLGALWLLFLPNAPYLVTDLIHIRDFTSPVTGAIPVGLAIFAVSGVLLFYASVAAVREAAACRGYATLASWIIPVSVWTSAIGMYLGRYLRWNSWDVLTSPLAHLVTLGHHLAGPVSAATAVVFVLLTATGLEAATTVLARLSPEHRD